MNAKQMLSQTAAAVVPSYHPSLFVLVTIFGALGNRRQEECMLLLFFKIIIYLEMQSGKYSVTVILVNTKNVSMN